MAVFGSVPIQQIEFAWIAVTTGNKPKLIANLWMLEVSLQQLLVMKSPNS